MQAGINSAKHIKQVYKAIKMFYPSVSMVLEKELKKLNPDNAISFPRYGACTWHNTTFSTVCL